MEHEIAHVLSDDDPKGFHLTQVFASASSWTPQE